MHYCSKGVMREAGRQGLLNTVIHWSPHTESRSWNRQAPALSVLPCLPNPACRLLAKLLSVCGHPKGPSTLATLFSHRWPRFCGGDIYSRRKPLFSSFGEHTAVCGSS